MLSRTYSVVELDALELARACNLNILDVALRVGVTTRRVRDLARDPRHARRVRKAVLELALEKERLSELVS